MEKIDLLGVSWTLLLIISNALAAVLWGKIKKLEKDVIQLQSDMYNLKFNYLDRFEALKAQIAQMDLRFTEKLVKLTTLFETHIEKNKTQNKEQ